MSVNDLIGKVASRAQYLANLKMTELRREHPDSQDSDVGNPPGDVRRMDRGDLINDILVDEFSLEFDLEIGDVFTSRS